jgi:predicted small secreted protein
MKQFLVFLAATAMIALSGCNTVQGIGQDLQKAGEKLEGAAKK